VKSGDGGDRCCRRHVDVCMCLFLPRHTISSPAWIHVALTQRVVACDEQMDAITPPVVNCSLDEGSAITPPLAGTNIAQSCADEHGTAPVSADTCSLQANPSRTCVSGIVPVAPVSPSVQVSHNPAGQNAAQVTLAPAPAARHRGVAVVLVVARSSKHGIIVCAENRA
jgi:hypothetical protein